jgi:hypothetical protein
MVTGALETEREKQKLEKRKGQGAERKTFLKKASQPSKLPQTRLQLAL